jgi:hypothetical protein
VVLHCREVALFANPLRQLVFQKAVAFFKIYCMNTPTDPKEKEKSPEEIKQEQTDPNLTELKGLTDPDEKLEPEGTDNPIKQ